MTYEIADKKEDSEKLLALLDLYKKYKNNYAKNIKFDPTRGNLSM